MPTAVDNRFKFVENDTADAVDGEYQVPGGIAGYTFLLNIGYSDCPLVKTAAIIDAPNGKFRFTFAHGDLRRGSYAVEIRVIDTAGLEDTFGEMTFDILRRVKG